MYLDKRRLPPTQGVRSRIVATAFVGLCAVFAGLGRLTLSGLVIVGVPGGKPIFFSLNLADWRNVGFATVFCGLLDNLGYGMSWVTVARV